MQFDRTDKVCRFYLLSGESIFRRCSTSRFQHLQDISIPCRGKAFPDYLGCKMKKQGIHLIVSIPSRGKAFPDLREFQKRITILLFPSPLGEKPFQTPPLRSLTQQGFQRPNRRTYFLQRKIILIQRVLEAESQSG
jgi:hypothetical protein